MSRSLGGMLLTSRSPMKMRPSVISSRPARSLNAVDFPDPDGPTSTRNSLSGTTRLRSLTAGSPLSNRLVTLSNVTLAIRRLALHCAGQDALHEVPLEGEEDDEGQRHRNERSRGQQLVGRAK